MSRILGYECSNCGKEGIELNGTFLPQCSCYEAEHGDVEFDPLGDGKSVVRLLNVMGNDLTIVNAARVSYASRSETMAEKDVKLIRYLIKNQHSSPLEHVMFQFEINAPLNIVRQWERHRSWKYFSLNEVSRRYTNDNLQFYIPKPSEWRVQHASNKQMSGDARLDDDAGSEFTSMLNDFSDDAIRIYDTMIEHGVAREQARMVLPQAMYVRFIATVDLHNLLHWLGLRKHEHAQWEIVQYAQVVEQLITQYVPITLKVWSELRSEKS